MVEIVECIDNTYDIVMNGCIIRSGLSSVQACLSSLPAITSISDSVHFLCGGSRFIMEKTNV